MLPRYTRDEATPAPPEGLGISLSAERLHFTGRRDPSILRGSFRLSVPPHHVVRPSEGEQALPGASGMPLREGEQAPNAAVPITLVVTGSRTAAPYVWRLVVPGHALLEPGEGEPVAVGSFAVDLRSFAALDDHEETWFLYAFSGEAMAGPLPIAFLHPMDDEGGP